MKTFSKTIVCSLVLTSTLYTVSNVDAMMQQDERTAPDTITTGEYPLLLETKDFLARFITEDNWAPLTSSHYILNDIVDSYPRNDMKQKLAIFGFHIALRYTLSSHSHRLCSYLGCSVIQKYLPTSVLVNAFEDLNSDEKSKWLDHFLKTKSLLFDELKQRGAEVFDYDDKSKDK